MKKFVIISWVNFEKRINDLFAVDQLLERGVEVEYWDVSNFTFYEHIVNDNTPKGLLCKTVYNKEEFGKLVSENSKETIYLCYMNFCPESYICYRILSKNNAVIAYCINGCQPSFCERSNDKLLRRVKGIIKQPTKVIQIIKTLYYRVIEKTLLIKPVDYLLVTCNKARHINACKTDNSTKIISFNSTNYQQAHFLNEELPPTERPTMVFLDEYMPFHPYVQKTSGNNWVTPELYFERMNKYFGMIEEKFNCDVVIAAHPLADKYRENNYFEGRGVFFGVTSALVKNSIGVITHNSTSINYAVIYNKPLFVIIDNKILTQRSINLSIGYANSLGGTLLSSYNSELGDKLKVNEKKYEEFKYQYMTNKETENVSNCEILMEMLS